MQYYKTKEVAELLRVHEQTVYRWIRKGQLPSYKAGDRVLIPQESVSEFLKKKVTE